MCKISIFIHWSGKARIGKRTRFKKKITDMTLLEEILLKYLENKFSKLED